MKFAESRKGDHWTTQSDCDAGRALLQEELLSAYEGVKDLIKKASDRSRDMTCDEVAQSRKSAEIMPLVAQREQATSRVEYSSSALDAMDPVLAVMEDRVDQLREHMKSTMMQSCTDPKEFTEVLEHVQGLIISLQESPRKTDDLLTKTSEPQTT